MGTEAHAVTQAQEAASSGRAVGVSRALFPPEGGSPLGEAGHQLLGLVGARVVASRPQNKVLLIDMVALTPHPHPKHERSSFRKGSFFP